MEIEQSDDTDLLVLLADADGDEQQSIDLMKKQAEGTRMELSGHEFVVVSEEEQGLKEDKERP